MEGIAQTLAKTVEVFNDFITRRAGLKKENLCLYGLANGNWEVTLPVEEVPPELPEPALGINFARDGMQDKEWSSLVAVHSDSWLLSVAFYFGARFGFGKNDSNLSLVVVHSDSWLLSVAFYFGARFGFGKNDRKRLFQMINDVPTVFEVVTGGAKQAKDQAAQINSNKSKSSGRTQPRLPDFQPNETKMSAPKEEDESEEEDEEDEEDEEQGETLCGPCGDNYGTGTDEFWICCDICERWFHGKCVKITPAKAEHIEQYKCNSCNSKRAKV